MIYSNLFKKHFVTSVILHIKEGLVSENQTLIVFISLTSSVHAQDEFRILKHITMFTKFRENKKNAFTCVQEAIQKEFHHFCDTLYKRFILSESRTENLFNCLVSLHAQTHLCTLNKMLYFPNIDKLKKNGFPPKILPLF